MLLEIHKVHETLDLPTINASVRSTCVETLNVTPYCLWAWIWAPAPAHRLCPDQRPWHATSPTESPVAAAPPAGQGTGCALRVWLSHHIKMWRTQHFTRWGVEGEDLAFEKLSNKSNVTQNIYESRSVWKSRKCSSDGANPKQWQTKRGGLGGA